MAVAKSDNDYKQAFHVNPTCNPYTGHKICYNGPTYKKLVRQFGAPPATTIVTHSYRAKPTSKPPTPPTSQQQLHANIYQMSNDQLLQVAQQYNIFISPHHMDYNIAFSISVKLWGNEYHTRKRSMIENLPYDMIKEIWQHLDYLTIANLHQTNVFFANLIQDKYMINITEKIRQSISSLPKRPTSFLLTKYKPYDKDSEVELILAQPTLGSTLEKLDILGKPLKDRPKYVVTYVYPCENCTYEYRYTQARVKPLVSLNENIVTLNPLDIEYDIQIVSDLWCFSHTYETIDFD